MDEENSREQVGVQGEDGMTPLHYAVKYCDTKLMEVILMNAADVDIKNYIGQSPLHLAIESGSTQKIDIVLECGGDIDVKDNNGDTPLHIALRGPHDKAEELCTLLLKRGANLELQNVNRQTPLHAAIVKNPHCVPLILRYAYSKNTVNIPDCSGKYPVHSAVVKGNDTVLKLLIDNGAIIESKDNHGQTPLHRSRSTACASMLLHEGAQVNIRDNDGFTPLHQAARYCDTILMKLLLMNGADLKMKTDSGVTPLHFAVMSGNMEKIELLLQNGADIDDQDCRGNTPLHTALKRLPHRLGEEICSLLLERGANVLLKDKRGRTPLHVAIVNPNCVRLILKTANGKKTINMPNNQGDYPLHKVAQNRNYKLLGVLVDNGAQVHSKSRRGLQPIHKASTRKCLLTLLGRGAQVNAKDNDEKTPLHHAVIYSNTKVLNSLLMEGAEVNCRDMNGKTPLMYADSLDIMRLLLQMGADVNAQDNQGGTTLHHVALYAKNHRYYPRRCKGRLIKEPDRLMEELLNWGALLKIKDIFGEAPLDISQLVSDCGKRYYIRRNCVDLSKPIRFGLDENYLSYQLSCWREIGRLKLKRIGTHCLFDIFNPYSAPTITLNKVIKRKLYLNCFKKSFPIYSSLLHSIFNKLQDRADMINIASDTIQTPLPKEIMLYILNFVDDDSLLNVLKAKEYVIE